MRNRPGFILAGAIALATGTFASDDCVQAEIHRDSSGFHEAWAIPLPGRPLGYALPRNVDGSRDAVVLVGPFESEPIVLGDPVLNAMISEILATKDFRKLNLEDDSEFYSIVEQYRDSQKERCISDNDIDRPMLVRIEFDPDLLVTPLAIELPLSARSIIALDADADDVDEIYVETPGELLRVGHELELVLADADLNLGLENPDDVRFPREQNAIRSPFQVEDETPARPRPNPSLYIDVPDPFVRVTVLGQLRLYTLRETTEVSSPHSTFRLPIRSIPDRSRLSLVSPQVRRVVGPLDSRVLAAGPVPYGERRLQSMVIEFDGSEEPALREAWSQLSEDAGTVRSSGYISISGDPYLWTVSRKEGGMQISTPQSHLTLFRLTSDRTKAGGLPVLVLNKADEEARGAKFAHDVDGDGREEFVVVTGNNGGKLSAFHHGADHSFSRSPRKQELDLSDKNWIGHSDIDADGQAELIAASAKRLVIYDWREASSGPLVAMPSDRIIPRALDSISWSRANRRATTMIDVDRSGGTDWITLSRDRAGNAYLELIRLRQR